MRRGRYTNIGGDSGGGIISRLISAYTGGLAGGGSSGVTENPEYKRQVEASKIADENGVYPAITAMPYMQGNQNFWQRFNREPDYGAEMNMQYMVQKLANEQGIGYQQQLADINTNALNKQNKNKYDVDFSGFTRDEFSPQEMSDFRSQVAPSIVNRGMKIMSNRQGMLTDDAINRAQAAQAERALVVENATRPNFVSEQRNKSWGDANNSAIQAAITSEPEYMDAYKRGKIASLLSPVISNARESVLPVGQGTTVMNLAPEGKVDYSNMDMFNNGQTGYRDSVIWGGMDSSGNMTYSSDPTTLKGAMNIQKFTTKVPYTRDAYTQSYKGGIPQVMVDDQTGIPYRMKPKATGDTNSVAPPITNPPPTVTSPTNTPFMTPLNPVLERILRNSKYLK